MTYDQMLNNVKARCSIKNESVWDADIRQYLNDAQQEISSRYFWPFLLSEETVTTVASTATYALAAPCTVLNVRDTANRLSLRWVDTLDFDRFFPGDTSEGAPSFYRIEGQDKDSASVSGTPSLVLYPVPAAAYTLKVREYLDLSNLNAGTDVSAVPPRFHLALVYYACSAFHESRGDARARANTDRFDAMLISMVEQLGAQPLDAVEVLRSEDERSEPSLLRYPPSYPAA